jgi:succinate dehydrogenase / fumarate reductase membrane anchor subunit
MKPGYLRSPMANARGLGSGKHGFSHWWLQRLSAIALVVLSVWFVYSLLTHLIGSDRFQIALWFESPFHALLMAALMLTMCVHARLGVQVVIEDYVHKKCLNITLIIANNFLFIALAALSVLAIFKLHFFGI